MYRDLSIEIEIDTHELICTVEKIAKFSSIIDEKTIQVIADLQVSIKENTKLHGSEHPITLEQLLELSENYISIRIYECAGMILDRASLGLKRCFGKDHPTVPQALSRLAFALSEQLKYTDAIKNYHEALTGFELLYGPIHPLVVPVIDGLGFNYLALDKPAKSEAYYKRLLDYFEAEKGKEHPDTLAAVTKLASAYQQQGKNKLAEKLCSSSLDCCINILGERHPTTQTSVVTLAQVKQSQGKRRQAEQMYRKSLACNEELLGYTHEKTLENVELIAQLLSEQNNFLAAEAMYGRALRGYEETAGETAVKTVNSKHNVGVMLLKQQKADEALVYLLQAYNVRCQYYGEMHPETLNSKLYIGQAYHCQSLWRHKADSPLKIRNAVKTLQDTLAGFDEVFGERHKQSISTLEFLIDVLIQQQQFALAESYSERLYTFTNEAFGPLDPKTADAAYNLATICEVKADHRRASALFLQAKESFQNQLDELEDFIDAAHYYNQSNRGAGGRLGDSSFGLRGSLSGQSTKRQNPFIIQQQESAAVSAASSGGEAAVIAPSSMACNGTNLKPVGTFGDDEDEDEDDEGSSEFVNPIGDGSRLGTPLAGAPPLGVGCEVIPIPRTPMTPLTPGASMELERRRQRLEELVQDATDQHQHAERRSRY